MSAVETQSPFEILAVVFQHTKSLQKIKYENVNEPIFSLRTFYYFFVKGFHCMNMYLIVAPWLMF